MLQSDALVAADNAEAAEVGEIVVLTAAADATVDLAAQYAESLAQKIVVSMANAMQRVGREFRPVPIDGGSVAVSVQGAAPKALVAAALHHVPAAALADLARPMVGDVIVVSDHDDARSVTMALVGSLKDLRAYDGGSLANAVGLETFCSAILTVNLRNSARVTLSLVSACVGPTALPRAQAGPAVTTVPGRDGAVRP
jgi:hypothetical protein